MTPEEFVAQSEAISSLDDFEVWWKASYETPGLREVLMKMLRDSPRLGGWYREFRESCDDA